MIKPAGKKRLAGMSASQMLYNGSAGHKLVPTVEYGIQPVGDPPGVPAESSAARLPVVRGHVVIMGSRCGDDVRTDIRGGHRLPDGIVPIDRLRAVWHNGVDVTPTNTTILRQISIKHASTPGRRGTTGTRAGLRITWRVPGAEFAPAAC